MSLTYFSYKALLKSKKPAYIGTVSTAPMGLLAVEILGTDKRQKML